LRISGLFFETVAGTIPFQDLMDYAIFFIRKVNRELMKFQNLRISFKTFKVKHVPAKLWISSLFLDRLKQIFDAFSRKFQKILKRIFNKNPNLSMQFNPLPRFF
jgi:hypothetical protein